MRLIDGDALADVLTAISSIKVDTGRSEEWAVTVNAARQAIAQMPTIEPKKGKWIKHSIGHEHTPWGFDCSECGEWLVVGEEIVKKYNYCPNCGADMRGEQP